MTILSLDDEKRLRDLANGIAKDVEDIDKLLERLGFTREDYDELVGTRTFKSILAQAASEWEGASNTHKRIKLKAAINIEQALPHFFSEMTNPTEPLSSKVKAFEAVSRVAGLGNPELVQPGGGQFFKLEINLGGDKPPVIIDYDSQSGSGSGDGNESEGALPPAPMSGSGSERGDASNTRIPRRELSKLLAGITNENL